MKERRIPLKSLWRKSHSNIKKKMETKFKNNEENNEKLTLSLDTARTLASTMVGFIAFLARTYQESIYKEDI